MIHFPTVPDPRGDLTFIEGEHHVPFQVRRIYYFYGMKVGDERGFLAHLRTDLCLIAVAGRVRVRLDDGKRCLHEILDRPDRGLLIPHMTWLEMDGFMVGTVCLVLSSTPYDKTDYVREYDEFRRLAAIG